MLSFAATKTCSDSLGDTLTDFPNTKYSDAVVVEDLPNNTATHSFQPRPSFGLF